MMPNGNGNGSGAVVEIAAPAKLNLALLVGPVRPDGFHEIASLMLPVTLADRVVVERTPGAALDVVCAVAPGENNLAAKLVRELEGRLGRALEVRVTITKHVPHGGGLGGGSSDAAATLQALERLFDLDLSTKVRYEVAMAVGSDVPFFLWPGPQLAMGRGQVLKDVVLPGINAVIVMPDLGLSTAAVYKWRDEDEETTLKDFTPRVRALSAEVQAARSLAHVAALVHNDLEASVATRKPAVAGARDRLIELGARAAAMTGSGAAVFGLFGTEEEAAKARAALAPTRAWTVTDLQPLGPRRGAATGPPRQG
jgi:4-diphosphocytidyl-2-C-methyl-D-erythritol kinase